MVASPQALADARRAATGLVGFVAGCGERPGGGHQAYCPPFSPAERALSSKPSTLPPTSEGEACNLSRWRIGFGLNLLLDSGLRTSCGDCWRWVLSVFHSCTAGNYAGCAIRVV